MAFEKLPLGEGGDDKLKHMFGPGQVDQSIRHAIQFMWMALPEKRRNVDDVEKEFRRLVDRALRDFREDAQSFGLGA